MAKRRPVSPEAKPAPKPPLRKCKYCRGKFRPARASGKPQLFCCDGHRKLYWRYGALPFDKLVSRMRTEIKKSLLSELRPIREAIEQLQALAQSIPVAIGGRGLNIHTHEAPE